VSCTAAILYLRDRIPGDLNYEMLKDINLTFILMFKSADGSTVYVPVAFVPDSLQKLSRILNEPRHFELTKKYGADSLFFLKEYLKFY